jgi:3'-5' exoribonuclease
MTATQRISEIARAKYGNEILPLLAPILDDVRFSVWTASASNKVHHYGKGGLARHTLEVIELTALNNSYFDAMNKAVDDEELFVAAAFHDVGKIWDYAPLAPGTVVDGYPVAEYQEWYSTEHKSNIYHISRSTCLFYQLNQTLKYFDTEAEDRIIHAILAHHGRLEWKSPVTPNSRMAWLLHLCDNMSALLFIFLITLAIVNVFPDPVTPIRV